MYRWDPIHTLQYYPLDIQPLGLGIGLRLQYFLNSAVGRGAEIVKRRAFEFLGAIYTPVQHTR